MGLSTGLKKLERRLSFGVPGTEFRLSMVRSDSDGRETFRGGSSMGSGGDSSYSSYSGSLEKPCREFDRKLSNELNWSCVSSSSMARDLAGKGRGFERELVAGVGLTRDRGAWGRFVLLATGLEGGGTALDTF